MMNRRLTMRILALLCLLVLLQTTGAAIGPDEWDVTVNSSRDGDRIVSPGEDIIVTLEWERGYPVFLIEEKDDSPYGVVSRFLPSPHTADNLGPGQIRTDRSDQGQKQIRISRSDLEQVKEGDNDGLILLVRGPDGAIGSRTRDIQLGEGGETVKVWVPRGGRCVQEVYPAGSVPDQSYDTKSACENDTENERGNTIDSCGVIDESGRYNITADLSRDTTCLWVTAPDVTIDGNDHFISGENSEETAAGIHVGADNVTVRNVWVTDWNGTNGAGIRYADVSGGEISWVDAVGNTEGIRLRRATGVAVTDNVATASRKHGIALWGASDDNKLEGNVAGGNGDTGIHISASSNNTLWLSIVEDNGEWAMTLIDGAKDNMVEDLVIGKSTKNLTTLSFRGRDVSVNATQSPPADPANGTSIGRYFNATGHSSNAVLDVELAYDQEDISNVDEESLTLWEHHAGEGWEKIEGSSVDTYHDEVTATIGSYSTFAAIGATSDTPETRTLWIPAGDKCRQEEFRVDVVPDPSFDTQEACENWLQQPPNASITTSTRNVSAGTVAAELDASGSSDPNNDIEAYRWDFDGDGRTDVTGQTVTQQFSTPGEHTIRLTVEDSEGQTDTATTTITVEAEPPSNNPPTAEFTASTTTPGTGETVSLDAAGSGDPDGDALRYRWQFGDGTSGNGQSVDHMYTTAGEYTVTLTVTDDSGASDTATETITVSDQQLTADFSYSPSSPSPGDTVTFTANATGDVQSYEWSIAGRSLAGSRITFTFPDRGSFPVRLTVTGADGQTDTVTETVTVGETRDGPDASFTYSPSDPETGETVQFDASGSSAADGAIQAYEWSFGDGSSGTGQETTHTYNNNGSYTVELTVTDDQGNTDTASKTVNVSTSSQGGPLFELSNDDATVAFNEDDLDSDAYISSFKYRSTELFARSHDFRIFTPEDAAYNHDRTVDYRRNQDGQESYTLVRQYANGDRLLELRHTVRLHDSEPVALVTTEVENVGSVPAVMENPPSSVHEGWRISRLPPLTNPTGLYRFHISGDGTYRFADQPQWQTFMPRGAYPFVTHFDDKYASTTAYIDGDTDPQMAITESPYEGVAFAVGGLTLQPGETIEYRTAVAGHDGGNDIPQRSETLVEAAASLAGETPADGSNETDNETGDGNGTDDGNVTDDEEDTTIRWVPGSEGSCFQEEFTADSFPDPSFTSEEDCLAYLDSGTDSNGSDDGDGDLGPFADDTGTENGTEPDRNGSRNDSAGTERIGSRDQGQEDSTSQEDNVSGGFFEMIL